MTGVIIKAYINWLNNKIKQIFHHISIYLYKYISAALLGTVIGLVLDKDKAEDLVPPGIQLKTSVTGKDKLEHGTMFYVLCGSGGAAFLSLIFTAVILFINDDMDLNDLMNNANEDEDKEDGLDDDGFPVAHKRRSKDRRNNHSG